MSLAEREVAETAVRDLASKILYARVDLMYELDGSPKLSELELIEPSLYFDFSPAATERFAGAILGQVSG